MIVRQFSSALFISVCLLLVVGCDRRDERANWSVTANGNLMVEHQLPIWDGKDPVIEKIYYDVLSERLYLKAYGYPADKFLSVSDVTDAPVQYFGVDAMGVSFESNKAIDIYSVFEMHPGGATLLSSSLLRSIGESSIDQPYGDLTLETVIDETSYEVERTSGFPFYGNSFTETLGKGVVSMSLLASEGTVLFKLEDSYEENSSDYSAQYSPDGRYLFVLLPDAPGSAAAQLPGHHQFLVIGPLEINKSKQDIIDELHRAANKKSEELAMRERRRQYRDGELSPDEYFGDVYIKAYQKLSGCKDIERIVGPIEKIELQGRTLDFGNPLVVGKLFFFDYESASGNGTLQVIEINSEHEQDWADTYRPYLETIDVRTAEGTREARCPRFPH